MDPIFLRVGVLLRIPTVFILDWIVIIFIFHHIFFEYYKNLQKAQVSIINTNLPPRLIQKTKHLIFVCKFVLHFEQIVLKTHDISLRRSLLKKKTLQKGAK
jgi:hypothetical protein